jgi:hypothetical protein
MKATDFEFRHQRLVHQLIVGAGFLTYAFDREDVVWRFVKDATHPHQVERFVFIVAMAAVAAGTALCTWTRAGRMREALAGVESPRRQHAPQDLGQVLYAIGIASLAPLWGFVILVAGETLRVLRLHKRRQDQVRGSELATSVHASSPTLPGGDKRHPLGNAFLQEAAKWGLTLTMVVFVITLNDRIAEVSAGASFLIGTLLNLARFGPASSIPD